MSKIADLRFDETTWTKASSARRAEWKVLIDTLIETGDFAAGLEGQYLLVTPTSDAFLFEALDEEGIVHHSVRLDVALLAETVLEYAGIIKRLDSSAHHHDAAWFQAVDMAKKVVHDRATGILQRAIGSISEEHTTLRRIFSLLFSLRVDTSARPHAHRHG